MQCFFCLVILYKLCKNQNLNLLSTINIIYCVSSINVAIHVLDHSCSSMSRLLKREAPLLAIEGNINSLNLSMKRIFQAFIRLLLLLLLPLDNKFVHHKDLHEKPETKHSGKQKSKAFADA